VILVDGASVRSRKLPKREAARLMGLAETCRLPESATHANNLTGDGVVAPVVAFLAAHVIEPLLGYATAAMAFKPCGASEDRSRRPQRPDHRHRKRTAPRRALRPPQTAKSVGKGMNGIAKGRGPPLGVGRRSTSRSLRNPFAPYSFRPSMHRLLAIAAFDPVDEFP